MNSTLLTCHRFLSSFRKTIDKIEVIDLTVSSDDDENTFPIHEDLQKINDDINRRRFNQQFLSILFLHSTGNSSQVQ